MQCSQTVVPVTANTGCETSWNNQWGIHWGIKDFKCIFIAIFYFQIVVFLHVFVALYSGQSNTWGACIKILHCHRTWSHETSAPAVLLFIMSFFSSHPRLEKQKMGFSHHFPSLKQHWWKSDRQSYYLSLVETKSGVTCGMLLLQSPYTKCNLRYLTSKSAH